MENELPSNLTITWHRSSESFVELTQRKDRVGHIKVLAEHYAPKGEQLPDTLFNQIFLLGIALAKANPKDLFHYARYDQQDLIPEHESNRDFNMRVDNDKKTIRIYGYKRKTGLSD